MNFLIPDAYAQGGAQSGGDPTISFVMLLVLFAVFYLLLIRPQQKRQKEHKQMLEGLSKGDEVVTNGGLLGKIEKIGDNFVTLQVAEGTQVHVQRNAVASVMVKGTMKSI